ncbi:hypothetical protein GF336_05260 [Candidatus Woesearchaeota archaeon]|nr:hypothetical protein [Candidatus Woesearchaeota archaeon]
MAKKKRAKSSKKKKTMKYIERNNVEFVGLNNLHEEDQKRIKEIIYKDYIKLERELKKINKLRLHFKQQKKGGRKKYSVHLMIDARSKPITASGVYTAAQWDPIASVHNVLEKARQQIIKKFRTDESYPKRFYRLGFVKRMRDVFFPK